MFCHRGSDDEKAVRWSCETRHDGRLVVLRQFMYTKFVIACDDDVNARDWNDVIWADTPGGGISARDTVLVENTPIDYRFCLAGLRAAQNGGWMPQTMAAKPTRVGVVPLLKILKLPRVLMRFGMSWLSLNN